MSIQVGYIWIGDNMLHACHTIQYIIQIMLYSKLYNDKEITLFKY